MEPEDFMPIGTTGKGDTYFSYLVECPKCFAVIRDAGFRVRGASQSAVVAHIEWHKGLFDGWEDA